MGSAEGSGAVAASGDADVKNEEKPLIALTFDDGPSSVMTTRLLDGLAERGVKATFFLVGNMAADNHGLVQRMAEEGHQIGLHTYDHSLQQGLAGLSEAQFRGQVDTTRDLLSALTGQTEYMLRPPYGFVDDSVKKWADAPIILWSVDPEDWKYQNARQVAEHIITHAQDGAIVLLHDIFSTSVEGALKAVDELMKQGYGFVTVEELFAARGMTAEKGAVYNSLPQ
jgi:peptidoglycan/xylan/chitin deacetylase (PgdA/CDA1 family)